MVEVWKDLSSIGNFEDARNVVNEALGVNLQNVFDRHIQSGTILEIGCGTGALSKRVSLPQRRRLFFPLRSRMIHLDSSEVFAGVFRKTNPGADIVIGDASALPLPGFSVNGIVSLSAFDTFPDLQTTVQEAHIVLKRGGKFVHILDLVPDPNLLIHDLIHSDPAKIPLPCLPVSTGEFPELTWKVVTENQIYDFIRQAKMDFRLKGLLQRYLENLLHTAAAINDEANFDLAKELSRINFPGVCVPLSHLFAIKMEETMRSVGFADSDVETYAAQSVVKRNLFHQIRAGDETRLNVFINNVGTQNAGETPIVSDGYVMEISVVQCIAGRKG